jgi:hypothetical protein
MKVNIHYARQIAVGFKWHWMATFYHLHVTVMLPWMSVEIGLFKKRGVTARRLSHDEPATTTAKAI